MNLFKEIEGLSGEELTSALVRFLVLQSAEIRERLIQSVSEACAQEPIISLSHFSCYSEYYCNADDSGQGRIDLVIEADNAVIGIENKLYAEFQDGQPQKYIPTLTHLADSLGEIRSNKCIAAILIILHPEQRTEDVQNRIKATREAMGNERCILVNITWEKMLEDFIGIRENLEPTAKLVLDEFVEYINGQIGFLPHYKRSVRYIRNGFSPNGTPLQKELVTSIWRFFPDQGKRLSFGETWVGYYFRDKKAWYGFVPKTELEGEGFRSAELVLVSKTPVHDLSKGFESVKLSNRNWLGSSGEIHSWVINFDETWDSALRWMDELRPIANAETYRDVYL